VHAEMALGAQPLMVASPWVEQQLAAWGLRPALARLWLSSAEGRVPLDDTTRLHLEYDAALGLVTCEVWAGGRRLFGIDDLA
jgi:hypothetical protein